MKQSMLLLLILAVTCLLLLLTCSDKSSDPVQPEPEPENVPELREINCKGGWIGDTIRVHGTNFGDSTDSNHSISIDSIEMPVNYWSQDEISAVIPSGASTGDIVVTVGDTCSNPLRFVVCICDSVSPREGGVGEVVSFYGYGFGEATEENGILFGTVESLATDWTDSIITVAVPDCRWTGPFSMMMHIESYSFSIGKFNITYGTRSLHEISPDHGLWGTEIILNGMAFGSTQDSSRVMLGDTELGISQWSDNMIYAKIPEGATSGEITVVTNGLASNGLYFRTLGISSVEPDTVFVYDTLIVKGGGFDLPQYPTVVSIGGVEPELLSLSDSVIEVIIPENIGSDMLYVRVHDLQTESQQLQLRHPHLISINPDWGPVYTEVTVRGENLHELWSQGDAYIHNYDLAVSTQFWSDSMVTMQVPVWSHSGPVFLRVRDQYSDSLQFNVFRINSLSKNDVCEGDTVSIFGESFLDQTAGSSVRLDGWDIPILSWTDTLIVVEIPQDAPTGQLTVNTAGETCSGGEVYVIMIPDIHDVDPDFGAYGDQVVISGEKFGDNADYGAVYFNGMEEEIVSWSDETIITEFPFGSTSGEIVVEYRGYASNPVSYSVFGITDLTPKYVNPGDTLTISGKGFGDTQQSNTVTVDDQFVDVLTWSDNEIVILTPDVADSGCVNVIMNDQPSNPGYVVNLSAVNLLDYLQQTTYVLAYYRGWFTSWEIVDTIQSCSGVSLHSSVNYPLIWDGTAFGCSYSESDYGEWEEYSSSSFQVSGTVSDDGSMLLAIDERYSYSGDNGSHSYWYGESQLSVSSIELESADLENLVFRYRISGTIIEYNAPVVVSKRCDCSLAYNGCDVWEFIDQGFDNPDCTYEIVVTFEKK